MSDTTDTQFSSARSIEGLGSFNSNNSEGYSDYVGANSLGEGGDFMPDAVPGLPPMPRRFLVRHMRSTFYSHSTYAVAMFLLPQAVCYAVVQHVQRLQ